MTSKDDNQKGRPVLWAALIAGGILLLPVVAIIAGFSLTPLMAVTGWAGGWWLVPAAGLVAVLLLIAFRSHDRSRT
jgi:hypothetical protein